MSNATGTLRVLLVCTGNVCRSPFATTLLRHNLGPAFQLTSAGIRALAGEPMTEEMQRLAVEAEAPDPDHRARQLDPAMIESADLVLAMTRQQRAEVAKLAPSRVAAAFAFTEFARLLDDLVAVGEFRLRGPADLPALVAAVAGRRGHALPPDDPSDDDIIDPYRRSEEIYRESAVQIAQTVDRMTGALKRLAGVAAR